MNLPSGLPSVARTILVLALLAFGTPRLPAEWGTLHEMHHYAECFGLDLKTPAAFRITMLSSAAAGNVFHEGERCDITFQLENLSAAALSATGRVEVIRYAQPAFEGDPWYPDLVRLETHTPAPLAITLPARGWTNLTLAPSIPETKGGYGLVVDLGQSGRAYLTSLVRTFRPRLERVQFPRQSLEEMPAPILERLGVQAIRWGVAYFKGGSPEDLRQWERIRRELKEFHEHKVTVVAEVGTGGQGQPLGRGRPHLDEHGFMKEGEKEDLAWLPELDADYESFCQRLVTEFGWPRGPITALKLWNEPWDGLSISGWGADMRRYRELFKRMGDAVFRARKEAGVDVLIGGCDSSANTIDKLFADGWDEWLPYLDFCSIHYQGLNAPVLFPPWNNRTHYKGRVKIWDTESWVANADDRFAGVVAANRAAGYDRSMGTLSRTAISTLSHNRVDHDEIRVDGGTKRIERHIESRPLAAAYGAVQHFIGEREFREILFTNGLPWVFAFHGLPDKASRTPESLPPANHAPDTAGRIPPLAGTNPDDGTVVVVGDLATLFEKGTPLFHGVRSLDEVAAEAPLRAEFAALAAGDARLPGLLRKLNRPHPLRNARLVIDDPNRTFTVFDVHGNAVPARDQRIEIPLNEKGVFLRADPSVRGSFDRLLNALRTARVEGLMPVEITAHDLTAPVASQPGLRLRLTSQHNQPIAGRLRVALGGLALGTHGSFGAPGEVVTVPMALAPRERKWIELPVRGEPRPDNTYPLEVAFDAGPLGVAPHTEALHVNWISRRTPRIDGQLDDWTGALPQVVRTDAAREESFEERMYLPFEKAAPGKAGGLAVGYTAADDRFFYFAAKIADDSPHPGTCRFATRDEDADFYPEVAFSRRDGRTVEYRWPAGVPRFSYRRWPAIPSSMPQAAFDNVLLAFNALPQTEKGWLTHLPGRFPGFIWRRTTDYEYALNHVAETFGGGTEIWRLFAPGMPYKHFYPRQPKHPLEGAVTEGRLAVRYDSGWRLVECAIPWSEIPAVKARRDAGQTVKFNFRVNSDTPAPDLVLSLDRSACEGISPSFHPNWIRQSPNELEFGFER